MYIHNLIAIFNIFSIDLDSGAGSYVLRSSYFQYLANLTAIEFVPATAGEFLVDLVTPACPQRKDFEGQIVDTYWCPISGSCEQYCFSFLESQDDM